MKNPLLDVDEDISEKPSRHLQFFEKIGLVSASIITAAILLFSAVSFFIDFLVNSNYLYAFVDLSLIMICVGAMYFIFKAIKRGIITEVLIDTAFQDGVYTRLEPLIENIAQAHVGTNIVLDRLSNIDLKVQNILKERYERDIRSKDLMQEPIALGTSIKFAIKTIFLMIVTMAAFMFFVNFNLGGITPYTILVIFIMWWVFITNEYDLWKEATSWSMVFLPILAIPVTVMLLGNLLNYNVMMATMYVFVGIYTFIYYLWAVYSSTGSLPFIASKKPEPVASEFFALQQKGLFKELFEASISKLEHKLQNEKKNQKDGYVWKK